MERERAAQRILAAFRAIRFRFAALSFFARAFPPLSPPVRRAWIAGESGSFGESFATSPTDMSTINFASWFGSRGRVGRFATLPSVARASGRGAQPRESN